MATQPGNQIAEWLVAAAPELEPHAAPLEAAAEAALARARAAWPALVVDERDVITAMAGAICETGDPVGALGQLAAEDLYLARACLTGSSEALTAFAAAYATTLRASLRAMGLAADVVDEVANDVQTKLFTGSPPKIATYSGRAALASWLRTVATRMAVDRVRRRDDSSEDEDALAALPDPTDGPELAHFRRAYHADFKAAFEQALASLGVRERNLLRHQFVDNLTMEEIGRIYGVHKTTAFRWLEAARTALSKRTRAAFQQRVQVVSSDLESILRLVQSQIDLSLSRVL